MTRTFSKIHGLGGARIGWAYCPAHIADALNRIRGPFNVSAGDRRRASPRWATAPMSKRTIEHNDALAGMADAELPGSACGDAERRQFRAHPFPGRWPPQRGGGGRLPVGARLYPAPGRGYGFPNALRMTVGTEEANRGVVAALTEFLRS